jgi:hypothetical protein
MENENLTNAPKRPLPNGTASLVLGIISIVLCWCYGIIGFITGVIGLILAIKDSKTYKDSPNSFTTSSINNYKAGLICSIIGTALSLLFLVIFIVILNSVGWDFNLFIEKLKHFSNKD